MNLLHNNVTGSTGHSGPQGQRGPPGSVGPQGVTGFCCIISLKFKLRAYYYIVTSYSVVYTHKLQMM